ncbi:ATP-binding protein [Amycolatopsis thailandensis]|uniref:ATP-binding protein n=1 Tax=Amycolatopsis thailandensis TaxID=589330 RepID=UPI003656DBDE
MFQVSSKRYEKGSIVLTSNKTFSEWGQVFGEEYGTRNRRRLTTWAMLAGIFHDSQR